MARPVRACWNWRRMPVHTWASVGLRDIRRTRRRMRCAPRQTMPSEQWPMWDAAARELNVWRCHTEATLRRVRRLAKERGPPQPGDQSTTARRVLLFRCAMRGSCADEEEASCAFLTQLPEALLRRVVEVRSTPMEHACATRFSLHAACLCALTEASWLRRSAATWLRRARWRARASRCAPSPPTTGAGAVPGCMHTCCICRDTTPRLNPITTACGRR